MAQVICGAVNPCGFRVHGAYYEQKSQFAKNSCARCSSPILIVEDNTNNVIEGATMHPETGAINES
jgi:hypothetical protein